MMRKAYRSIDDNQKARLVKTAVTVSVAVVVALIYVLIADICGGGLKCLTYELTGFKCPGCGATTMATCLLRADVESAFKANPVLLCSLPFWGIFTFFLAKSYITDGKLILTKRMKLYLILFVLIFAVFGITRNFI